MLSETGVYSVNSTPHSQQTLNNIIICTPVSQAQMIQSVLISVEDIILLWTLLCIHICMPTEPQMLSIKNVNVTIDIDFLGTVTVVIILKKDSVSSG